MKKVGVKAEPRTKSFSRTERPTERGWEGVFREKEYFYFGKLEYNKMYLLQPTPSFINPFAPVSESCFRILQKKS